MRRARGLTLIEVLVASAVLSVLFMSIFALVMGTLRMRDEIENAATPYAIGPVVLDLLEQDLLCATIEPYKDLDAFEATTDSIGGEQTTKVDFVAAVPSRARVKVGDEWVRASQNEVGWHCRRSETVQRLMALYRREDLGVDEEPLAGGKFYKVCDRVKEFRIDWFAEDPGDPGNDDDSKGEQEWSAKKEKRLPYACRITLSIVGEAEGDDSDDVDSAPVYTFVTWVAFPSRFDKADQQQQQQPGGGNR